MEESRSDETQARRNCVRETARISYSTLMMLLTRKPAPLPVHYRIAELQSPSHKLQDETRYVPGFSQDP